MPVATRSRAAKAAEETTSSELQGRLQTSEGEIERTKAAELPLPLMEKAAAASDQSEALTLARSRKARRDAAASDAVTAERHISSLGNDLLLEILLRLPSLATLVRAAYTCRSWRHAVASSPTFRRRFCALHPPPLLGLFFDYLDVPCFPLFVPARPRDRDLAAAVRGSDFFLTSLQDHPEEASSWKIMGCGSGNVLLLNLDDRSLAVLNPLSRQGKRAIDPPQGVYEDIYDIGMFWSDENPMSLDLAFLAINDTRIQITVFSSDTGVWSVSPSVDVPVMPDHDAPDTLCDNHFLHWFLEPQRCVISLDPRKMEISTAKIPECLTHSFGIGKTKDQTYCVVYSNGSNIQVLLYTRDDNGIRRWAEDKVIPLDTELKRALSGQFDEDFELNVLEVCDGYVYLTTSAMDPSTQNPCWFLSLCLETMKLEKLFRRKFDRNVFLYFMPWPTSLLGSCSMFAQEDTPLKCTTPMESDTRENEKEKNE